MSLLRLDHLTKAFGNLVVTKDVTLTLEPGERHGLIGPNGAGKTSLLNQIGGQLKPSGGRIVFKGRDITGAPPETIARAGIGRTFQKNTLFRTRTVRENVRLAVQAKHGRCYDPWSPLRADRATLARADELLDLVRLEGDRERIVSTISYGEQRQLEIAVALAGDPELLLLDEPTSGMSPAETERLVPLIGELPSGIALLIIEHDMTVVFSLAQRMTVLYYGEVLASGTPAEIQNDPRVREVYLGVKHD